MGSVTVQFRQQAVFGFKKTLIRKKLKECKQCDYETKTKTFLRAHNKGMVPV